MLELFNRLFIDTSIHESYLQGEHAFGLVLLSLLVSTFSTTMALLTAQIARRTASKSYRNLALIAGAVALGGGVWSMHFIGMMAYKIPSHIHYTTYLTLLSILPALITSWLALRMLTKAHISKWQLIGSGTLVGLGIGTMHYTGMAAMQSTLQLRYDPSTFALSIVIAVLLAILSLWIRYGLTQRVKHPATRLLVSGVVMGLAIAGMHYMGMAAVRFTGIPGAPDDDILTLNTTYASLALSSFAVTTTLMVAALSSLIQSRELRLRIEASKSRLSATLDTAVDGIITIDSKGLIQDVNNSAERLFGFSAEEMLGRNIKMLMPEPDQSRHDAYLANYHSSGDRKIIGKGREVMGLRKDGSLMPMRLAVGRMDLPGELLFVGFVSDISERHALEASLREAAEQAEQAAAAKSIFLANMSHEIRTPMNSIIGFTELLLQGDASDEQRKLLSNIRQSSRTLLGLINDILDTTKMEKGRLELEHADFSLKALAMQVESTLWPSAYPRKLAMNTHYPDDMPLYFKGDSLRILQVLTNIVGNAIKFTERGGVEVSYAYVDERVHIQVRDSGIGMSEAQIESIFAPFTQADASISRRFGGTGLGTTISRQLVDLMHGQIDVKSQLGHGSTFDIWLPLPLGEAPAEAALANSTDLPPLKFLIADDVPQNLELLSLTLEGKGHQVISAQDGEDAFKRFISTPIDVILMDMHMPGTDGLQATRLIRSYEREHQRQPTPIIALTASVMIEDQRAAQQAGMNGFAVKPLDVPRLFGEVARVLQLTHQGTATLSPEQPSAAKSLTPIDWTNGALRWGNEARLENAIQQFLDSVEEKYPLVGEPEKEQQWQALLFSVHGIHGAAATLSMPLIAQQAGDLERLLHQQERENVSQRVTQLCAQIDLAREEIRLRQPAPATLAAESSAPSTDFTELMPAMQELLAFLAHNELDDPTLDRVCTGLERMHQANLAHSLRDAIDSFEFQQAHAILQQLINQSTGSATSQHEYC